MASKAALKAAEGVGGGLVQIGKKQTVQSTGLWEGIRRVFSLDPNRSNGVPLNPHYRTPAPGANDPLAYDDPVTAPAGDIADNPYWKRDNRRSYPALSTVSQADMVGLLSVGSAAQPKVELIGEAGEKQLVAAKEQGQTGLASFFQQQPQVAAKDTFVGGLPPTPSGTAQQPSGQWDVYNYTLNEEREQTYGEGYPCRTFK